MTQLPEAVSTVLFVGSALTQHPDWSLNLHQGDMTQLPEAVSTVCWYCFNIAFRLVRVK